VSRWHSSLQLPCSPLACVSADWELARAPPSERGVEALHKSVISRITSINYGFEGGALHIDACCLATKMVAREDILEITPWDGTTHGSCLQMTSQNDIYMATSGKMLTRCSRTNIKTFKLLNCHHVTFNPPITFNYLMYHVWSSHEPHLTLPQTMNHTQSSL